MLVLILLLGFQKTYCKQAFAPWCKVYLSETWLVARHGFLQDFDCQYDSDRCCLRWQGKFDEAFEVLGHGSTADVLYLESLVLGEVAAKTGRQRDLQVEAQMAGAVRHAHILPALALVTQPDQGFEPDQEGFLAMRRAGPSLKSILQQRRSVNQHAFLRCSCSVVLYDLTLLLGMLCHPLLCCVFLPAML